MKRTRIVLRRVNDESGSRLLAASMTAGGDVLLEGSDFGEGVERVFGVREYEWAWTVPATHVPALHRALGETDDLLSALEAQFSGDNAALLAHFLETHGIPTLRWSRLGDD